MSSVRMCDSCGEVFSEREEGWSTAQGTMFKTNENGKKVQETIEQDNCGDCTELKNAPRKPMKGIETRARYDETPVDIHDATIVE